MVHLFGCSCACLPVFCLDNGLIKISGVKPTFRSFAFQANRYFIIVLMFLLQIVFIHVSLPLKWWLLNCNNFRRCLSLTLKITNMYVKNVFEREIVQSDVQKDSHLTKMLF